MTKNTELNTSGTKRTRPTTEKPVTSLPFESRMLNHSGGTDPSRLQRGTVAMDKVMEAVIPGYKNDPSTENTPARFMKYLAEYTQPIDSEKIFGSTFKVGDSHPGMVVQTNIPFRMMCEHHLLPATGLAHLAYIPHNRVLGLSKLARLVDAVGVNRPSLQEHIAEKIVDLMVEHLKPKGVALIIEAEHGCMFCRGINKPGVGTTTSHVHGVFRDVVAAREEFMSLVKLSKL